MKLKELLKQKQAELLALKDKIDAGDADAITKGAALASEIEDITKKIEAAEKANAIISGMGTPAADEDKKQKSGSVSGLKSIEQQLKTVDRSQKGWGVSAQFKEGTIDHVTTSVQVPDIDKTVDINWSARVADLFGQSRITGNAVTYYTEGDTDGAETSATITAENTHKTQLGIEFTPHTEALVKIAGYVKESDEMLEDNSWLADTVNDVMRQKLVKAENDYIINKVESLATSIDYPGGDPDAVIVNMVEGILEAKTRIEAETGFTADTVIMHPTDYYAMIKAKDSNGQYYGGGWFSGAYGNGAYANAYNPWGLTPFVSSAVTQGSPVVVAGREGVKVYRKNDATVRIYEQNEDDAIFNRVTVVAEERLLAVLKNTKAAYILTIGE